VQHHAEGVQRGYASGAQVEAGFSRGVSNDDSPLLHVRGYITVITYLPLLHVRGYITVIKYLPLFSLRGCITDISDLPPCCSELVHEVLQATPRLVLFTEASELQQHTHRRVKRTSEVRNKPIELPGSCRILTEYCHEGVSSV
jgi:hypothetical protein